MHVSNTFAEAELVKAALQWKLASLYSCTSFL